MLLDFVRTVLKNLPELEHRNVTLTFIALFFVWRLASAFVLFLSRPRNIRIEGKTLAFGKWFSELDFIFHGADVIVEKAEKTGKSIFAVPAISCYQVLVSTQQHMIEFARAGEDIMSFRAAMNERLFFKHTMFGFELNDVDPHDAIPRRVAKVYLRENLSKLSGALNTRVEEVFQRLHTEHVWPKEKDPVKTSVFDLSKSLVARMNNQILFGDELGRDEEFERESIRYAWHTIIIMQILRQIPAIFVPIIAKLFLAWSGSMHKVGTQVERLVSKRMANRKKQNMNERLDGTEWVISSSQTPAQGTTTRIVQQMVALLFASMHQMQMAATWAIVDLGTHPEYIESLRAEIRSVFQSHAKDPYDKLLLMDCFLRESSRLNPLDGLTVQRKSLQAFTFSDGSHVPAGHLVAVPQRVVMLDPERYVDPTTFDPHRYTQSRTDPEAATTKFTDVNWNYTFWGSPRKSCPGRWYASYALKHILVYLIMNYDFEIVHPNGPTSFIWTTAIVPRSDIKILLQRRAPAC